MESDVERQSDRCGPAASRGFGADRQLSQYRLSADNYEAKPAREDAIGIVGRPKSECTLFRPARLAAANGDMARRKG